MYSTRTSLRNTETPRRRLPRAQSVACLPLARQEMAGFVELGAPPPHVSPLAIAHGILHLEEPALSGHDHTQCRVPADRTSKS